MDNMMNDDMKMDTMAGDCEVCGMHADDMMAHMKDMADQGDMKHKEAMDKRMMDHKDAM